MAKVPSESRTRKTKVEGGGEAKQKAVFDVLDLPVGEQETLWKRVGETFELERRLAPYEMLASNDAHDRELAKKVQKAAREAKRLAARLNKLSEMVLAIERQRKGGPLSSWLWHHGPEGRADLGNAMTAALEGRPHIPAPRPWEEKPKGGTALVAGILATAFEKIVVGTLAREAAIAKARKGGRPRGVLFNAACRLLSEDGWDDPQIAEKLVMADLAQGPLDKVLARVKTTLNRSADSTAPVHPHAEAVEEIVRAQDEQMRRLIAEGRMPARIGGRESRRGRANTGE